jgi:excisionase family DNA binding protein
MNAPERLMTPAEVAEMLSVSVTWVLDHASRRRPMLPSVKLGRAIRFHREEVESFVREYSRMRGASA